MVTNCGTTNNKIDDMCDLRNVSEFDIILLLLLFST